MNFIEEKDFVYVMNAHTNFARKESKKYRKFDGKTPYYFHPFWCATTIASETNLDERIREKGTKVLLYHDLPEDTKLDLPKWLSFEEIYDIEDMTFENGFKQESEEIWEKADRIKLYKLYDKTSNLLDAAWMSDEKKELYLKYTSKLCEEAEKNYGELNITKMFKGVF